MSGPDPSRGLVQIATLRHWTFDVVIDRVRGVRADFLGHRDHDPIDPIHRTLVVDECLGPELLDGHEPRA